MLDGTLVFYRIRGKPASGGLADIFIFY